MVPVPLLAAGTLHSAPPGGCRPRNTLKEEHICSHGFCKQAGLPVKKVYLPFFIIGVASSATDGPIDLKFWLQA